jgi:hypothetical protein
MMYTLHIIYTIYILNTNIINKYIHTYTHTYIPAQVPLFPPHTPQASRLLPLLATPSHLHHTPAYVSIRQHTSAYVEASAAPRYPVAPAPYACIRSAYVQACIWHTFSIRAAIRSAYVQSYVRIRQHTSAYVSIRQHTSAYVSIRQHTSAYVRIRQHTSA